MLVPTKISDLTEEYAKAVAYVAEVAITARHKRVWESQSLKNPSLPVEIMAVIGFPLNMIEISSTCVIALLWADLLNILEDT